MNLPIAAFATAALATAALALSGCADTAADMVTGPQAATFACAPDFRTADAIVEAINEHDDGDLRIATQFALPVPPGTAVRVVAHTEGQAPKVRVRILGGAYTGELCWYARNVEGLLTPA